MLKDVQGVAVPNGPGTPGWGDVESCQGGGWCSRRACGGYLLPTGRAHQPGGTEISIQAVVGAQAGSAGGSSSLWPAQTSLGGQGVLPWRWSVLKEGLRGIEVRNDPGTPALGDGEFCPGGGRCSKRACGGQQLPEGSGTPAWGIVESCLGGGRCSRKACGGK